MAYKQLTFIQRCRIYGLWRAGSNQTQIARDIGVHKSTISRELKRNITFVRTALGSWQYKPGYAQGYTEDRHKNKPKKIKFTENVKQFTKTKIQEEWSPEQISDKDLYLITNKLNNRPRKSLGYSTPNEIFNKKTYKARI